MMFRTIAAVACLAAAMEEDQALLAVKEHIQSNKTNDEIPALLTALMTGGLPGLPCKGLKDCKTKFDTIKTLACTSVDTCKQSFDKALTLVGGNQEKALRMIIAAAGFAKSTGGFKGVEQTLCDSHVTTACSLNLVVGKAAAQPKTLGGTPGQIVQKVMQQSTQESISSCLQAVPLAVTAGDTFGCGTAVEAAFACVADCPVSCTDAMDVVGVSCPADPCPSSLLQAERANGWGDKFKDAYSKGKDMATDLYTDVKEKVTEETKEVVEEVKQKAACARATLMKAALTTALTQLDAQYPGVCTDAELATLCP